MSSQPSSETWGGRVELRAYLDIYARYKWVIVGLIAVALAIAAVLSYVVLPPSYESSVVVELPVADDATGLGISPRGYEELAGSPPVMDSLKQKLGLGISSLDLMGRFSFSLEPPVRLLGVTAKAGTAAEAKQLALTWVDAYSDQALTLVEGQITKQKEASQKAVGKFLAGVTTAEDNLAAFDQESPISLMRTRLSGMAIPGDPSMGPFGLERELVTIEENLRDLTTSSIPTDEARAAFLADALNKESKTLIGPLGNVGLPNDGSGAGVTSNDVTLLNPVYLQLSQDLAVTRTRLATNAREAQALRERISPLQRDIEQLRTAIVQKETERRRLDRQVQEATALYQQANEELDTLLATEGRVAALARLDVLREPALAESPAAPRKVLNMAIGGLAGALLSLIVPMVLEWVRNTAPVSVALSRKAVAVASPDEGSS